MKKIYWLSLTFTFLILLIVVVFFYNLDRISFTPKEENYENYYDYFIQKVRYEQNKSNLKVDTSSARLILDSSNYFKVFDKLSLEKGWVFDCFYFYNGDAGRPIFYVRKDNQNRDSLTKTFENRAIYKYSDSIKTLDYIKLSDKKNGYFQFLIFAIIGDDFAKFWHSNYGNVDLICSKRGLLEIMNRNDEFHRFNKETKSQIEKINYFPQYTEFKDSITFKIVVFNAWNGFSRNNFSITKSYPHKLKMLGDSLLVEYNCRIMF